MNTARRHRGGHGLGGRFLCLVVVLTLGFGSLTATAAPSDPRAKERLRAGLELFAADEFAAAAAEFEAGYRLEADPVFLFAWAQAEYNRADCRKAVELYNRFIAAGVPRAAALDAEGGLLACARKLAAQTPAATPELAAAPVPQPALLVATPSPGPRPDPVDSGASSAKPATKPVERDAPRKWHRDPAGGTLFALGLVGGGAGAALLIWSNRLTRGPRLADYEEFVVRERRAQSLQIAGVATAAVAGAVLFGGVARWAVVARRSKRASPEIGWFWGPSTAGLTLTGTF